jgi:hypothetical protein
MEIYSLGGESSSERKLGNWSIPGSLIAALKKSKKRSQF